MWLYWMWARRDSSSVEHSHSRHWIRGFLAAWKYEKFNSVFRLSYYYHFVLFRDDWRFKSFSLKNKIIMHSKIITFFWLWRKALKYFESVIVTDGNLTQIYVDIRLDYLRTTSKFLNLFVFVPLRKREEYSSERNILNHKNREMMYAVNSRKMRSELSKLF